MDILATGLRFPEGPVWLKDGSIALVEIEARTVTIVTPDGGKRILSHHLGEPRWTQPVRQGPRRGFG